MPQTLQLKQPLRGVTVAAVADRGLRTAVTPPRSPSAATGTTEEVRAAYERGLRDGEGKLSEQLLQQRNEFLELQRGLLQSLRGVVPQVVRESENALIALAIEAAQRFVAGLPITTDLVEAAVREALKQVEDTAEVVVALHADDLVLLQKSESPLLAPVAGSPKITFRSSPDVTRGGCLVQTRFGVIDARRETKVELLKNSLQP